MKRITGHITERNNKWYGVINLYDADGKRRPKWQSLDLEANGNKNKREAQYRLNKILEQYNSDDLYLYDKMTHAERERSRIAHMQVIEYLPQWLESHKINISETTYLGYKNMIKARMIPYFKEYGDLKVKDITGDEINEYYYRLRTDGLKGKTAQRHHGLLHLAFKSAVKRRIIPSNPVEQADRPKAVPFIASYYNANELKELLEKAEGDVIYIPILLAAYYGLRRSEAVGVKWSAIDFENKTISINHKIVENENGVKGLDHFKILLRVNELRSIRFHDLRHSCASLLLAQGVPMKMIQDWLGHSDMSTTANIYSHIDSESKKASASAIGLALG